MYIYEISVATNSLVCISSGRNQLVYHFWDSDVQASDEDFREPLQRFVDINITAETTVTLESNATPETNGTVNDQRPKKVHQFNHEDLVRHPHHDSHGSEC